MFLFRPKRPKPVVEKPVILPKTKRRINIPAHFQKNYIITYSESQIKQQLSKYPGLLRTLAHAYEYQIIFAQENQQKQYWFCKNIEVTMNLLKYLNQKNWTVDWRQKPFTID